MIKIDLYNELESKIAALELSHRNDGIALRQQFKVVVDGFTPMALIKDALHQVINQSSIKSNLGQMLMGVAAGYLSKWIIQDGPKSKFKKILGSVVMLGITNLVSNKLSNYQRNAESID